MISVENNISNRIYYEICSSCNLNCIHCSDLLANQKKLINIDEMIEFQKSISPFGVDEIILTGGEPFLHPKIYEIIDKMCQLGKVYVTTNATIIDVEKLYVLLDQYPNLHIQISYDAFEEKTFDFIRGKGSFKKVSAILNELCSRGKSKQIGLSMTIMKPNIEEVSEVINFAKLKKLAYLHFPELLCVGNANKGWDQIAPDIEEQIRIETLILAEMAQPNFKITCNRIQKICNMVNFEGTIDCSKFKTLKVVPSGDILPCPVSSNLSFSMGKISDIDILYKIRNHKHEQYYGDAKNERCSNCKANSICKQKLCSNCKYFSSEYELEYLDYCCKIYSHHFNEILQEGNVL